MKLKRFREWKRGTKVAAVLVACGVLGVGITLRDVIQANWDYNRLYETAKREGAIVTAQDLRNRYGAEDADNAAPIITAAIAKWDNLPQELRTLAADPTDEPANIAARAKITTELASLEGILTKPAADFKFKWEEHIFLMFPHLTPLKNITKTWSGQARTLALRGDAQGAARKWRVALHLANLTGESPALIAGLVQVAQRVIVRKSMAQTLAERPQDAALRSQVRQLLDSHTKLVPFPRYLEADLAFYWMMVQEVPVAEFDRELGRDLKRLAWIPGMQRAWKARTLEYCIATNRKLKFVSNDPVRALGIKWDHPPRDRKPGIYRIAAVMEGHYRAAVQTCVRDVADTEALLAALDVLDARQKLGRWPDGLPFLRRDPFGAEPLRYRADVNGVRIWSIGPDYKDSNGVAKSEDAKSDDIVVKL